MIIKPGTALAVLLSVVGCAAPAAGRAGNPSNDPPWNSEHFSRLPEEIRKAVVRLCGQPPLAAHFFATYNTQFIVLHFEQLQCGNQKSLCTKTDCLHQVYGVSGGHYRLLRSYYGPTND